MTARFAYREKVRPETGRETGLDQARERWAARDSDTVASALPVLRDI